MKQPNETDGAATTATVQLIKVADVVPDPNNRKDHDADKLRLLADEIAVDGLLQPIVVRPTDGGKFMLIAGERRWRAFQLLKRAEIPATVRAGDGQKSATRMRVAENFHREDLTPIEKARDLEQLFKDGWTQSEVAAFVGAKDQSTISNMMRLLKLPKKVQDWLQDGSLNAAQGKALLRWEGRTKLVEAIAQKAVDEGTPSKALEKGLPFVDDLVDAGLVFDFDWTCGARSELPKEWRDDPDFVEAENHYEELGLYCLDANKGRMVSKQMEDARAARQQPHANAAGGKPGGGLTAAQIAERKRTIEKNKAARAAIDAAYNAARSYLNGTSSTGEAAYVVCEAAADDNRTGKHIEAAADELGIKLGKRGVDELAAGDTLRVVAMAKIIRDCEEAKRYAGAVPESAKRVAGAVVRAAATKPTSKLEKQVMAAVAKVQAKAKKAQRAVITDETRYQVKKLVEAGRTGAEIAKQLKISLPSVQNIKKALGLVRPAQKGGRK